LIVLRGAVLGRERFQVDLAQVVGAADVDVPFDDAGDQEGRDFIGDARGLDRDAAEEMALRHLALVLFVREPKP